MPRFDRQVDRLRLTLRTLAALRHGARGRETRAASAVLASGDLLDEIDDFGASALRLVVPAGIFLGLLLSFQVASRLADYGALSLGPPTVVWFATRELGPLAVAILVIARSAARIAGELADLRTRGALEADRAHDIDPVLLAVAPRLLALIIVLPLLTIVADALILVGAWIGHATVLGASSPWVVAQLRASLELRDLAIGVGKAALFGLAIGLTAAVEGLAVPDEAPRGSGIIGRAAARAVVAALLAVLAIDTVANAFFYFRPALS